MYDSQTVANKIKQIAKDKGIATGQMLVDCGLNKNALSTMQSQGFLPRLEAICKIADYLDVSIDYLVGRTDKPEINK